MTEQEARSAFVAAARSWLGRKEADGSHREIVNVYNAALPAAVKRWGTRNVPMQYGWPWCQCFVSACAVKAGLDALVPMEISCWYAVEIAKNRGLWVEDDAYVPRPGDVIEFDWDDGGGGDAAGTPDHTGIVESCDGKTIIVIEGNNDDAVKRRTLSVNGRYIRGWIVPRFAQGEPPSAADGGSSTAGGAEKSVDELAAEVIAGKWGVGAARREALTAAGYSYAAVQARVNQLLSASSAVTEDVAKIARDVIAGKYGNGLTRRIKLAAKGYDYKTVQAEVNRLLLGR